MLHAILTLFNVGIMADPNMEELEGRSPTYSLDPLQGIMSERPAGKSAYHAWIYCFYIAFTIIVFFIFVNLFQGVLGEEYSSAKEHASGGIKRMRAQMIVNLLLVRQSFSCQRETP